MDETIIRECSINGLYVIEPKIIKTADGYSIEVFNEKTFLENGVSLKFVQDNQSLSQKGVLRGLHFQKKYPQGKLIRVLDGEIFDVAVDLRKKSSTFGQWFGIRLSSENKKMVYIPENFAHGFYVLSEQAVIAYKCTDYYHPEDECGIIWNDPDLAIQWPILDEDNIVLSSKDRQWGFFKDIIL